ncbi:hypothetical protein BpHYR1_010898 [Brachionus plicatilis]|uniref:SWIM-type domain-containing protein n=1 Tax=Brachionus plicatilis TaxID=10195 RepID=A0A3M7QWR9_BRAPC|nr:hypothetical protein BpHYR1_010898 [Brachionus plicatilis]
MVKLRLLTKKDCDCKYFVKFGFCCHQLALKSFLKDDEFVNKQKRVSCLWGEVFYLWRADFHLWGVNIPFI